MRKLAAVLALGAALTAGAAATASAATPPPTNPTNHTLPYVAH